MNIILLEKIKKLGDIGDEVKVKSGYARNFLVPNKKALYATSENRKYFEEKKTDIKTQNDKLIKDANEKLKSLSGQEVILIRAASDSGQLFVSVSTKDIVNGLAEKIPFKKNSFDIITLSFGLRNFTDIPKSLIEIKRVLKPKGKFYCLEFSEINNRSFRNIFHFYSKLIPIYGELILNNEEAYSYLIQSIKEFPNQIQLTKKLLKAGFKKIEVFDILNGVAAIHVCELWQTF